MSASPDLCMIITTCGRASDARALAEGLLRAGLAGCVQLQPIDSLFIWHGRVSSEEEVRVVAKTQRILADAAMDWLREQHPYEVPQILRVDIDAAELTYAEWLAEVTREAAGG